ncbi:hypothetical protein PanWU01x14_197290, partial [Parasponia andersonii]
MATKRFAMILGLEGTGHVIEGAWSRVMVEEEGVVQSFFHGGLCRRAKRGRRRRKTKNSGATRGA